MNKEIDYEEIYHKLYEFLMEKNLQHTAFSLKNEVNLTCAEKPTKGSDFLTLFQKGKIYEDIEDGVVNEMDIESLSSADGLVRYIDKQIYNGLNGLQEQGLLEINRQISAPTQPVQVQEKVEVEENKMEIETDLVFKYMGYKEWIFGHDEKNQNFCLININDTQKRLYGSLNDQLTLINPQFFLAEHLVIQDDGQKRLRFLSLSNFEIVKEISLQESVTEFQSFDNLYSIKTTNHLIILSIDFDIYKTVQLQTFGGVVKIVSGQKSLFILNEQNQVIQYDFMNEKMLKLKSHEDMRTINIESSQSILIALQENQKETNSYVFAIFRENFEEYQLYYQLKKAYFRMKVYDQERIAFYDENHILIFDLTQMTFIDKKKITDKMIQQIHWIENIKILIQFFNGTYSEYLIKEKHQVKHNKLKNFDQIGVNLSLVFLPERKELILIQNPEIYSSLPLQLIS